jgi:hypothetical protein
MSRFTDSDVGARDGLAGLSGVMIVDLGRLVFDGIVGAVGEIVFVGVRGGAGDWGGGHRGMKKWSMGKCEKVIWGGWDRTLE